MTTTLHGKFTKTLALFLPGIFLLGFNIGTGSVTSMAKAGATYGMSLLWTIVASCLATFFLISIYGRYTLVTGETALQAFRKHIHPGVGIFFIVALTAGVSGSVMGVMGIIADISYEWSKTMIDGGIAPIYFAIFLSHWSTLFSGTAKRSFSNVAWRSSWPLWQPVSSSISSS